MELIGLCLNYIGATCAIPWTLCLKSPFIVSHFLTFVQIVIDTKEIFVDIVSERL